MISRGVEISIAGGGGEMVRAQLPASCCQCLYISYLLSVLDIELISEYCYSISLDWEVLSSPIEFPIDIL